jgi:hypothetical protein
MKEIAAQISAETTHRSGANGISGCITALTSPDNPFPRQDEHAKANGQLHYNT